MDLYIKLLLIGTIVLSLLSFGPGISNLVAYGTEPSYLMKNNATEHEYKCYNQMRQEALAYGIISIVLGLLCIGLIIVILVCSEDELAKIIWYLLIPGGLLYLANICIGLTILGITLFTNCNERNILWHTLCATFSTMLVIIGFAFVGIIINWCNRCSDAEY